MSTRRRPALSGPSKKISSWVRPGVCEVRASALRPVSALMRLDLPTLERPANATSMPAIGGKVSIEGEAQTNCQWPAKSFRPCSISFASMSVVMRRLSIHHQVSFRDGALAPDPESRTSGFDAAHRPGTTRDHQSGLLDGFLGGKRRLDIVEQLTLHAVLAHDEALLQH